MHRRQFIDLVARARDVMPAAEVDPLHASQQMPELVLHGLQRALQRRKILLAQGVEVQPADVLKAALIQL